MDDVLIVGAGPAGAVAATVLARAGARVRLLDRATFPPSTSCAATRSTRARSRCCGASSWPRRSTRAGCASTACASPADRRRDRRPLSGRPLRAGAPAPRAGLGLLQQAMAAGAQFEPLSPVRRAMTRPRARPRRVARRGGRRARAAAGIARAVTIAADGRRSTLAFALGLAGHPARPRRWAVGATSRTSAGCRRSGRCTCGAAATSASRRSRRTGERLPRASRSHRRGPAFRPRISGAAARGRELARDPLLRDRFAGARLVAPPVVLGPLAVDAAPQAIAGCCWLATRRDSSIR